MLRIRLARYGSTRLLLMTRTFTVQAAGDLMCSNGFRIEVKEEEASGKVTERFRFSATSDVVKSVSSILKSEGWTPETLVRFAGKITPEEAFEILRNQKDAQLSLDFFQWTERQKGFKHQADAFVRLIGLLGRRKNFAMAWEMLKGMHRHHYDTSYAFAILVDRLRIARMFKDVAEAMAHMSDFDVTPTLPLYTFAMRTLLRGGCIQEARNMRCQMTDAGFSLDPELYKILLSGMARNGALDDICTLHKEMMAVGILPDPSIYFLLISIFSKAGTFDKGYRVFEEMVENNCFPTILTDDVLACALYGEKAVQYADMVLEAGKVHGLRIYNRVYCILVQFGKANQAVELHRRWMPVHKQHILWREKIENIASNLSSYQILISGLCESGHPMGALKLFEDMLSILRKSDSQICNCLLRSLSNAGMLKEATDLCYHIMKYKMAMSPEAQREFFSSFRKSGHLLRSFKLFKRMKRAGCIDRDSRFELIVGLE